MKLYGYVSKVETQNKKGKKSSRRIYVKDDNLVCLSLE